MQSFCMIDQFIKFCLILSHSASLAKFSECSCEVIKTTRVKPLQKELTKIYPLWLFMILDVPTEPLKGFTFQMKGCKWDFGDIKSVMHIKLLFFLVYSSSWIIIVEVREINLWPTKSCWKKRTRCLQKTQAIASCSWLNVEDGGRKIFDPDL